MTRKYAFICIFVSFLPFGSYAQRTTVYTEANANFKKGLEFFDLGVYGMAQAEFSKVLNKEAPVNEPEYRIIKKKAELYYARSAVRLEQSDGQKLMLDYVRKYRPDPAANMALWELANFYYNARKYEEAVDFYAMMDRRGFSQDEIPDLTFKHGYSLFELKRFDEAKAKFASIMGSEGEYYYPAHYYHGMSSFYGKDYDGAIKSWKVAEKKANYRRVIPYYLAQIYFAKQDYEELIAYATPFIDDSRTKNRAGIHQLIGQAYFEMGDYEKALPYLEYYEQKSKKLRAEDFYQLGFVQYQNEKYKACIPNFKELDDVESPMGQSAMFYLADAYLRTGDKASARSAFQKVTRLKFNDELREEALFNYAKLSIELHFDRDAVNALQRFEATSKYYTESQELLSETLINTKDYRSAIKIIEGLPTQTPRIKEAYQKVAYLQGLQDYMKRKYPSALRFFEKSLEVPVNQRIKSLATFWSGEIYHQQKNYGASKAAFTRFLTSARGLDDLPSASSLATGYYTQAYNYLKTNDHVTALKNYENSIAEIKRNGASSDLLSNKILPDCYLRAGDCNFKRNRYPLALQYYDQAIAYQAPGFEYAIFQKAVIQGLQGRLSDKVLALDGLVQDYPNSAYADDALLEMGETYQEMGEFESALRPLYQLVSRYKGKSPLLNQAYLRLGLITYNLGDVEKALEHYKTIFENNPSSKEAKDALAAIEEIYVEDLGQPDEYVAFVESIPGYKVSGGERDSLNYLVAQRLYENAEYAKAITAFTEYITKYPRGLYLLDAYYNRGECASIEKQFDQALADYELVLSKGQSRHYVSALEKAALISYNHSEEFEKAFGYFSKLETLTDDPEIKFEAQLGAMRSAYRIGNKQATADYASKVMQNTSASREELAVAQFYRGKILFEEQSYDEALALFEEVVANSDDESTAEARYLQAYIYYLKSDLDQAEAFCETAYKESGSYPYWVAKSLILLGDIYVDKDDFFNAKAALEAVIDNFADDEELVKIARHKVEQIEAEEAKRDRISGDTGSN